MSTHTYRELYTLVFIYSWYKAIVDTLAGDSVSSDKFYHLETIVSSLAHSHTATHQQVLQSTEQQRTVIKRLITQLDELNTRHKQLQKFIDDCATSQ
jgi:oligoribonuclease (3'-5' exoribonuclease)